LPVSLQRAIIHKAGGIYRKNTPFFKEIQSHTKIAVEWGNLNPFNITPEERENLTTLMSIQRNGLVWCRIRNIPLI